MTRAGSAVRTRQAGGEDFAANGDAAPDYGIWSRINLDVIDMSGTGRACRQLGGAATYAALGARLAAPERSVAVAAAVGTDFDAALRQWYADWGIDLSYLSVREGLTPRSRLLYEKDADRVEVPLLGREHFGRFSVAAEELPPSFFEGRGIYLFKDSDRAFFDAAPWERGAGTVRVLWEISRDSCRPEAWPDVAAVLERVDLFSINHAEAAELFAAQDVDRCLDRLRSQFAGVLVYRMGPRGSLVAHGSRLFRVSSVARAPVVDPTGAGNAYGAAFLVTWCESSGDLQFAARLSAAIAGLVVAERGPLCRTAEPVGEVARALATEVEVVEVTGPGARSGGTGRTRRRSPGSAPPQEGR